MKELLSESLVELVNWAKDTASFLSGELPMFAKEIVSYGVYSHLTGFVVCFLLLIAGIIITYKMFKAKIDYDGLEILCFGFGGIEIIICFSLTIYNILEFVKAIVAPKLYLIEQIMNLIK